MRVDTESLDMQQIQGKPDKACLLGPWVSLLYLIKSIQQRCARDRMKQIRVIELDSVFACRARQNSSNDGMAIFWSLLSFFMECFFQIIEYLTKFATIMASITGEDFMTAGRKATDLLAR